ncbi:hypothetical protein CYMTET_15673 [Cymbomonas tetramitiformis]|uniref:NAD-dependent epimerase/dehydratase domain-containing protein n=1 Tax=Cymbomonas tetramitiformis TaxID=36881 RepID=A0AAE0L8R7_9CHLO|nr:hypothetical protein CYMTET_15673 [Cymbomonas tetramitiformis]
MTTMIGSVCIARYAACSAPCARRAKGQGSGLLKHNRHSEEKPWRKSSSEIHNSFNGVELSRTHSPKKTFHHRWRALAPKCAASQSPKKKILVLGGTGFVGSKICELAIKEGYEVVSISRRGAPRDSQNATMGIRTGSIQQVKLLATVDWRQGDVVEDPSVVARVLEEGGFDAVVHAIGMLLASDLNKVASGSGSVPSPGSTYDQVTRQTAFAAVSAFAEASTSMPSPPPFVFVSAAEAGWSWKAPVAWLEEYLIAKRAVEAELLDNGAKGALRPIILRPSLVWTPERAPSIPPVAAFYLGNLLGIPGVDRPVMVDVLAGAALQAISDSEVEGIQDFRGMESLARARGQ